MKFILAGAYVEVAGVDLTSHVSSVAVIKTSEEIDVTTFADDGKRRAKGIGDDSFELNLHHDFDPGSVDATLWPLYVAGDDFLVRVRPSAGPVSTTNPEFTGDCILLAYTPLAGDAGDLSQAPIQLPVQGAPIQKATE